MIFVVIFWYVSKHWGRMTRTGECLLEISGSRFIEDIFFVFVNMGPYGSKNFKTQLLLQIEDKSLETCPEFSSQRSTQNNVGDN